MVERLVQALGGGTEAMLAGFSSQVACKDAGPEHGVDTPTCANLWATERDGCVSTGKEIPVRFKLVA